MSKDSQIIDTKSLYVNPERGVATLNYSQNYFTDIPSLVNSDEVKQIVKLYLDSRNPDNDDDAFDNASVDKFIDVLKKILFDDDSAFDEYDPKDILASVEELYSYYRSLLRVSVISYNDNKIVGNEFRTIDTQFNNLVRKLYRILEEKLQGFENRTYRQVNAATNATILVQQHDWKIPAGYEELRDIDFINTVMLRPPMMMHTKSNKREGVFSAVEENPIDRITLMNYEPAPEEALNAIIPKYVNSLIFGGLVESHASENGARMQAMDSATSNAEEMISDLSLKYNRARQASITQELTEIIAGASAIS